MFVALSFFTKKLSLKLQQGFTLERYFVHSALYTRPAQHLNVIYFTDILNFSFYSFRAATRSCARICFVFFIFFIIQSSAAGQRSAASGAKRTFCARETLFVSEKPALGNFPFQTIMSILTRQLCPIRVENFLLAAHGVIIFDAETTRTVIHRLCAVADFPFLKIGEKLFPFILSKQQQLAITKGWWSFSQKFSNRFSSTGFQWAELGQFFGMFHHFCFCKFNEKAASNFL